MTARPHPSHSAVSTPKLNGGGTPSRPGTPGIEAGRTQAMRPARIQKRRRYDDDSIYEGYSGAEDDVDDGGGGGRKMAKGDAAWSGRDRSMNGPVKKKKVEAGGYMGSSGGSSGGSGVFRR